MPKVYSYIRFSTPEQSKGQSYPRQLEKVKKYCQEHKLAFQEHLTIDDLGKSAYTGANIESGRLGKFLQAVKEGRVEKGSILFVENFDRISRKDVLTSMGVLGEMLNHGITVVANDRKYTQKSVAKDQFSLLEPIFTFIRANEESRTKGVRVRDAWNAKRKSGLPLTHQTPAWCRLDGGKITLDEPKAATVRRIFTMARTMGPKRIARVFNQDKTPEISHRVRRTAGWMPSYIAKILSNPAVIGHFQPHIKEGKKRVPDGELREGYYPQAITPEEYYAVRRIMASRDKERGRVGTVRRNLFTGLAYAGDTEAPMHFVDKGTDASKGGQYLVSDRSIRNYGEAWWAWRYDHFEQAFLRWVVGVDFSYVIVPTQQRKDVGADLEATGARLAEVEAKIGRLIQLAEGGGDIPQLKDRLDSLRQEADTLKKARQDLQEQLYVASSGAIALQETQDDLKRVLARLQKPDGRDAIRAVLQRFISRISLWPFGLGQTKRPSKADRTSSLATLPCFEVQFKQTDMRQIVVIHPDDPARLLSSDYFNDSTNATQAFENKTEEILALMFPKSKRPSTAKP